MTQDLKLRLKSIISIVSTFATTSSCSFSQAVSWDDLCRFITFFAMLSSYANPEGNSHKPTGMVFFIKEIGTCAHFNSRVFLVCLYLSFIA